MIKQQVITRVGVREREPIAKGLRRAYNAASAEAWEETAQHFHREMRDDRFTQRHAEEAGYYRRKGQAQPIGSKAFRSSYHGRKYYARDRGGGPNQANPMENTGATRRAVQQANISSTRYGAKVSYPGARVFNFRHPRSQIRMNEEFRRLTDREARKLAEVYDAGLDRRWE